ncbi:threonine/serine exporter family protein [Gemella cuniculi]|uniref:threonine/serine exporter family protein n=1 Tax=Gemella cuniculi TaxID=150240 RepID=UPI0003F56F3B|nr:threonine/serine exporter family protein [Gemella cuniculi]
MEYNIYIQFMAGFIVTFAFAIFFNAPKKSILSCSMIGAVGWLVYVLTNILTDVVVGSFLGALSVGLLSTNASKILKMPATIFIYTGIIPLVPGYGMYNTMQNLVTKNYNIALKVGLETILQAGAIAMGILLASVFSDSIKRVKIQRKK